MTDFDEPLLGQTYACWPSYLGSIYRCFIQNKFEFPLNTATCRAAMA